MSPWLFLVGLPLNIGKLDCLELKFIGKSILKVSKHIIKFLDTTSLWVII